MTASNGSSSAAGRASEARPAAAPGLSDAVQPGGGLTIGEIVALTGAAPGAGAVVERRITNIASLDAAGAADIIFFDDPKHLGALATTRAGACLLAPRFATKAPRTLPLLVTPEPYRAFIAVARALFPATLRPSSLFATTGRATAAHVHGSAWIEAGVTIEPLAIVGPETEIGTGTLIAAGAVIGRGVAIGRDCAIGPGATLIHALLGDRVVVHAGVRIGQDGFGFLPDDGQPHRKIPHGRRAIVQDGVEIGPNSTIDRGAIRDTMIGEGSKIGSLVRIGHSVVIGRHCLIAGQTGLSASAKIGDFVVMGGQVDVAEHVTIGDGAVLGPQSGVVDDVPPGARLSGWPARTVRATKKKDPKKKAAVPRRRQTSSRDRRRGRKQ